MSASDVVAKERDVVLASLLVTSGAATVEFSSGSQR